jgi:hypothetical protein
MGHFFQKDSAVNPILGPGRGACQTYSMATRHDSAGHLIAYTQEFCYECPDTSGITPAVFVLNGDTVTSVRAASAEGSQDFDNQIRQIFPPSLWAKAVAVIPHVDAIGRQARTNAHCG